MTKTIDGWRYNAGPSDYRSYIYNDIPELNVNLEYSLMAKSAMSSWLLDSIKFGTCNTFNHTGTTWCKK